MVATSTHIGLIHLGGGTPPAPPRTKPSAGDSHAARSWSAFKSPRLWTEGDHSHSPSVGSLDNQADCFWTS